MTRFAVKSSVVCGLLLIPAVVFGAAAEHRFRQLTAEELTPEQRPPGDEVLKVSSFGLQGPYNVMLRSPEMANRLLSLMDYDRFRTSVPPRLNEFAILIQSRMQTSQVEWKAHYPLAMKAGLSDAVAADLRVGRRPADMQPDEAAVYDLCTELSAAHRVSDKTFAQAKKFLSDQQVVDLVSVYGTYVTVAMMVALGNEPTTNGSMPLPALTAEELRQASGPAQK